MSTLNRLERELVALGAALGSNCVPCIEYHIPEARKAGLSESKIAEAVQFADKVRKVPAAKVLASAFGLLRDAEPNAEEATSGCSQASAPVKAEEGPCCG